MTQLNMFVEGAKTPTNGKANKLDPEDRRFHDWYRFVLSFPPHLVRTYLDRFRLTSESVVLDPFCGTGTTLVEAKLRGIASYGIEANAFAQFASAVKVDWSIDPSDLDSESTAIAEASLRALAKQGINDNEMYLGDTGALELRQLTEDEDGLLLANSISPLPLHKTLTLLDFIKKNRSSPTYRHQLLALANALVYSVSNLRFGPEVGIGKPKTDAPVVRIWLAETRRMASDLRGLVGARGAGAEVFLADARQADVLLPAHSIDAVITSPPYPNEKDYTRITRLESVILGFITNKAELQSLKRGLVRSNTRNVYKGDDDDLWIAQHPEIQTIADKIEERRLELGKTSGFEKLYGRVTKLYFGGMARHLAGLRQLLRPNAHLAYVVGDQASYLRVMIHTGQLIGAIAEELGYQVVATDLFRTRLSTATRDQLREEVVVLKWGG